MPFVDGELPDADKAVHLTAAFIAEKRAGFAQAHGQVAIAASAVQVRLELEGAGHGPEGEYLGLLVVRVAHDEHAVAVMIPVTADFVQIPLSHQRRFGLQIASAFLLILHPALQQLDDGRALWQQNGQPLPNIVHCGKILQVTADLVVVAALHILHMLKVGVEFLLGGEGRAVDAAQHLVFLAAAPVCAGYLRQLEGLEIAQIGQVRPDAQVGEVTHFVKGERFALGQVTDQLHLVRLARLLHPRDGLGAR